MLLLAIQIHVFQMHLPNISLQSYGVSSAIWDHTVLPIALHGLMHSAFNSNHASQYQYSINSTQERWKAGLMLSNSCIYVGMV